MRQAVKFYRDKLGFQTNEHYDNPKVVSSNTLGTKLELYPLGLLPQDISSTQLPRVADGFADITLVCNVERQEDVNEAIECAHLFWSIQGIVGKGG
ncbi:MAG: hypothetical protein IJV27_02675 [Prevotella sp.]|nr:hypothetical protein [Prevotella sp.]